MQGGRGGRHGLFGFGDPFAGFGDPFAGFGGFGRPGSLMSNFFGGANPFDDPFFTNPFGSMMQPRLLGPSMFGSQGLLNGGMSNAGMFGPQTVLNQGMSNSSGFIQQAPVPSRPKGPIIKELSSDDEDDASGDKEDDKNEGSCRKHPRTSKGPYVEDPDDEAEDSNKRPKHGHIGREFSRASTSHPQPQTFMFQSSTVTYGGPNGACYTSSTTRRTGGDGIALEEHKEADTTTGKATHQISRGIGNKVFQDMEGHGAYYTNLMNEGTYNENYEDILDTSTEFQQTPPIKDNNPSSKATRKQKGKNFTEEEDRLLVSAWLNVSTDATQGTNQKYSTFWKRIYMFYETNRGDIAERSQNSLMHRWTVIQEIVSRFCGALSQIENRNQSGQTIHDKVEQAEQLFKTNDPNNKSFLLRHCWLKLKDQPKWHIRHNELAAARTSNKKQKTRKNSSPGILDLTTEDGNEVLPAETIITDSDAPKRPIGKKKAKESLRGGGSDVCKEALDILWAKKREDDAEKERKREERYAKSYALEKERLELDKEKHALEKERVEHENNNSYLKRIAEEERIMSMDLSCMNELQRQFYMSLQTEILAKRCS